MSKPDNKLLNDGDDDEDDDDDHSENDDNYDGWTAETKKDGGGNDVDSDKKNDYKMADDDDINCLFCPMHFRTCEESFGHCLDKHSFNIVACKSIFDLDCYSYIKLINYARTTKNIPSSENSAAVLKIKSTEWADEKYLKPVIEDDPLLCFDIEQDLKNVFPSTKYFTVDSEKKNSEAISELVDAEIVMESTTVLNASRFLYAGTDKRSYTGTDKNRSTSTMSHRVINPSAASKLLGTRCCFSESEMGNVEGRREEEEMVITLSASDFSELKSELNRSKETLSELNRSKEMISVAKRQMEYLMEDLQIARSTIKTLLGEDCYNKSNSGNFHTTSIHDLTPGEDDFYFSSYGHYSIHEDMLKDKVRTESYMNAIFKNGDVFRDALVLDVGCGTGILSMFAAKAGARLVVGVDQSDIVYRAMDIVRENGLEGRVKLFKGKIEEVILPVDKFDIIVSEWMGYNLLYESMLDSVLWARDRYLLEPNAMTPQTSCMLSKIQPVIIGKENVENLLTEMPTVNEYVRSETEVENLLRDIPSSISGAENDRTERIAASGSEIEIRSPAEIPPLESILITKDHRSLNADMSNTEEQEEFSLRLKSNNNNNNNKNNNHHNDNLTANKKVHKCLMLPSSCNMYLIGSEDTERHFNSRIAYWDDVYGFKMTQFKKDIVSEAQIEKVYAENIMTSECLVKNLDLITCQIGDLDFEAEFSLNSIKSASMTALVGYFDVHFDLPQKVQFSTHPSCPDTHWKQTVFLLKNPVPLKKGECLKGKISCRKNPKDPRSLIVVLTLADIMHKYYMQ